MPGLELERLDPSAVLPADELARAERYRGGLRWLWVATVLVQLATLVLLVRWGRPLAAVAARVTRGQARTGLVVALLVAVAVWAAALVPQAVAHWWTRRYGLAVEGYGGWLEGRAVGLVILAGLAGLAVWGSLLLASRFGRRWWIPASAGLALLALVVVGLQPVVERLSTGTTPLPAGGLATAIVATGERLGVDVGTVAVAKVSARTTAPNARVTGLGPTRRVVLDDTLLDGRFTGAEIRAVAAHEVAHVARRHVFKGVAWFALLVVPGTAILAWLVGRRGDPGGGGGPALVPFALLVAFCLYLAALPVANAISRRYEREADWLALVATEDPGAAAGLVRTLAREALVDPEPPAWGVVVLATHPPAVKRLAMALSLRAP